MIQVNRGRAPKVLTQNQARWLGALKKAKTPKAFARAQGKYGHRAIKDALVTAFHGKCAYCESHIRHIDYGHIEHFRPKSKYPAKTFTWSNLLLACGICNGSEYKGERFPLPAEGGPFIDPCSEDPSPHLVFEYDPTTQVASVRGRTPRGDKTETLLGLNRKDLRTHRSNYVKKLWFIARQAQTDPEAQKLFDEAQAASSEYSAFAMALRNALP